jgi:cytochrome c peroxidase
MAAPERALLTLALCSLIGCSSANATSQQSDPEPSFAAGEREALQALHYDPSEPPADPSNRVADDAKARALGQRLFFEPGFSGKLLEGDNDGTNGTLGTQGQAGRVSCASCHVPSTGFVDTRSPHGQVSLGAEWTLRRAPSLLEVAFAPLYNWDGRRDALWNQALGVMEGNREFNSGRLFVAEVLFQSYRSEYEAIFGPMPAFDDGARFPQLSAEQTGCVEVNTSKGSRFACRGLPGDGADYDGMKPEAQALVSVSAANAGKALAAYVRQLRCGPSRFDQWLDGNVSALSRSEQRGAKLFVGKGACVPCHGGSRLTDDAFHNVGLSPAPVAVAITDNDDHGAATGIALALADATSTSGALSDADRHALPPTITPALEGAFRTPGLRCASTHPSYLHTGQLATLEQVVRFFDRGGDPAGAYPGVSELSPLGLSEQERADLVAFLGALEGPGPEPSLLAPAP